jgi:predicted ATPase
MEHEVLQQALERLAEADILLVQGLPPESDYRFKHALIQDAAYENLLKSRRQVLHRRVGEVLRDQFAATAEAEPELLAHHFTQAAMTEDAIEWWGEAGERSLQRSALAEAIKQITRALDQIAVLPQTPSLRREEIRLQVALINPLLHMKGYAAPESKSAVERARLLIEQAEVRGEPPEDPLLLFSVLYGLWVANYAAFNGDALRELAAQFLALAINKGGAVPLMLGHRVMATSLVYTGDIAEGRAHYDQAIALYDPATHLPLATRFGQDIRVVILCQRSLALWLLGYPDSALADAEHAVKHGREISQAATLMYALYFGRWTHFHCGIYAAVNGQLDEFIALVEEKGAEGWKGLGIGFQGCALALTGKAADAVHMITSGLAAFRSIGGTLLAPLHVSYLAAAHADLGQFDEAWRCVGEAMNMIETAKERCFEAEANRIAGEIAVKSPAPHTAKAEGYFERALAVARQQQAKSWELRAATSLARLWRDQGKVSEARELLAPVYGWFTEGFDTRNLKEAKALLGELAS